MEGRRIRKDEAGSSKGKRKDKIRKKWRQAEERGQREDERRKRRKEGICGRRIEEGIREKGKCEWRRESKRKIMELNIGGREEEQKVKGRMSEEER